MVGGLSGLRWTVVRLHSVFALVDVVLHKSVIV